MSTLSADFQTLSGILPFISLGEHRYPVMLRGPHGIGKSEFVYSLRDKFREYGEDFSEVVELRASQMTEGDILGLPFKEEFEGKNGEIAITDWLPPKWLKMACESPCLLFFDEVDRAIPEVRQALMQLTDSRNINGHYLHEKTIIYAAVNGGEHEQAGNYQVGKLDPAELSRWWVIDVSPSLEDWLNWASGKVHRVVHNFIADQGILHFEHKNSFESDKVYPSRRSWVRFSNALKKIDVDLENFPKKDLIYLATGFVGYEAAVAFSSYIDNMDKEVSPEDIIDKGKLELLEDFGLQDYQILIQKMEESHFPRNDLSEKQIENLAAFSRKLPGESLVFFMWRIVQPIFKLEEVTEEILMTMAFPRIHQVEGTAMAWVNTLSYLSEEGDVDLSKITEGISETEEDNQ